MSTTTDIRGTGGSLSGGSGGVASANDAAVQDAVATDVATTPSLPHVIIDSDANNEMDDQHAIAYALFNADIWHIDGITTNATSSGGPAPEDTKEAKRIVDLCASAGTVTVHTGATGSYDDIKGHLGESSYDGKDAVEFLVQRGRQYTPSNKLTLVAIGKLTNLALAFERDAAIVENVRVLWLGSNWPNDPGDDSAEYNLRNDRPAVERVIDSNVQLDVATVRYSGNPEPGTAAVVVSLDEMKTNMKDKGPMVSPVQGRNGGTFTCFGNYSIDLMSHIGNSRALYDMAAVAILKNPGWATPQEMPAPSLSNDGWTERPNNPRKLRFFHSFNRNAIVADLFTTMSHPVLQQ
jgi:inosine-uridine nucleoside N-ribohydrolase